MWRRWGFLLRPQWLALYVVVIAFAYLCFTVLAPWQLGKNTSTSRENAQIARSLEADPVPVTTALPQQDSAAPEEQWQQVTATGRFLPEGQVLARLRVIEADPAFEVLVPFAVEDGPTVLVNRGYVRPVAGSQVPAIEPPPAGTVTICTPDGVGPPASAISVTSRFKRLCADSVRTTVSIELLLSGQKVQPRGRTTAIRMV